MPLHAVFPLRPGKHAEANPAGCFGRRGQGGRGSRLPPFLGVSTSLQCHPCDFQILLSPLRGGARIPAASLRQCPPRVPSPQQTVGDLSPKGRSCCPSGPVRAHHNAGLGPRASSLRLRTKTRVAQNERSVAPRFRITSCNLGCLHQVKLIARQDFGCGRLRDARAPAIIAGEMRVKNRQSVRSRFRRTPCPEP